MIARKELDQRYISWNNRWGAPFGKSITQSFPYNLTQLLDSSDERQTRKNGYFGLQPNNDTREAEYPWAFYAAQLSPGMKIIEIGGGLSGFQFVLSKSGCEITNIDPSMESLDWPVSPDIINKLNRAFNTRVKLLQLPAHEATLPDSIADRIFCISVIEHIPEEFVSKTVEHAYRWLKPGGLFILTVDLFLDLFPFSDKKTNKFGSNRPIADLLNESNFELAFGNKEELLGFPEFNPKNILANLPSYFLGKSYPTLAQTLILRKPSE